MQQYQRYFEDAYWGADLLQRARPGRARRRAGAGTSCARPTTAIIGAMQGITRPENLRMADLLDIQVEIDRPGGVRGVRSDRDRRRAAALFRRAAPTRRLGRRSPSRTTRLHRGVQDIRADYGSTCTILTEHLGRWTSASRSGRRRRCCMPSSPIPVLRAADQSGRSRSLHVSLSGWSDSALDRKMEGARSRSNGSST